MRTKRIMIGSLVLLVIANVALYLSMVSLSSVSEDAMAETKVFPWDASVSRPVPFDEFAEIVQFNDLVSQLTGRGSSICLPIYLPSDLELSAILAPVQDGKIGSPIILVCSNSGDASMRSAELTIEISGGGMPYHVSDPDKHRFIEINSRKVFICEEASVGWREYFDKYGTEYAILVDLVIGGVNYEFRFSPVLTLEDALDLVSSMTETHT